MTQQSRLAAFSSSSQMFEQGSPLQQRMAVLRACAKAVADVNLTGNEIDLALQAIASAAGDPDLHDKLNAIADEFDEKYFDLSDEEDDEAKLSEAASAFFQKARAAAALAFGVSGDGDDLREALYEAIHAANDESDIVRVIEMELTAR